MKKIATLLFISILFVSCGSMLTGLALKFYQHPTPHYYTNGDKQLIFMPMIHLNKPEFYDEVKHYVDSLRNDGYVFVYESVKMSKGLDSIQEDIYRRKFRRVVGFNLTSYTDKNNENMKRYRVKGAIGQTMANTGLDKEKDILGDIGMDSLVRIYEKEKGEILLDDYDLKTPLNKKYKGDKLSKSDKNYLILTVRNKVLTDKIASLPDKKIVVLYGALHRSGFTDNLKKDDAKWYETGRSSYEKLGKQQE
nr:hypothetical protein [uncultured Flavobacterium sp.]